MSCFEGANTKIVWIDAGRTVNVRFMILPRRRRRQLAWLVASDLGVLK